MQPGVYLAQLCVILLQSSEIIGCLVYNPQVTAESTSSHSDGTSLESNAGYMGSLYLKPKTTGKGSGDGGFCLQRPDTVCSLPTPHSDVFPCCWRRMLKIPCVCFVFLLHAFGLISAEVKVHYWSSVLVLWGFQLVAKLTFQTVWI